MEKKRLEGKSGRWLMLWQNEPSIILGRHQNPWTECNFDYLRLHNLHLVRRASGGGTVYHDLGNSCVTIFTEKHEPEKNLQFACDALREAFNVNAHIGPRKDIFIDDFKVSGSAFRITNKATYHHFTLLLSADLTVLGQVLTPKVAKVDSRATASVRSKVLNIGTLVPGLTHDRVAEVLSKAFSQRYHNGTPGDVTIETWTLDDIQKIPEVQKEYQELIGWPFIYGRTPEFTQHFELTSGEYTSSLSMKVNEGIITETSIDISPNDFVVESAFKIALNGHPYHSSTLEQTLKGQEVSLHDPDSLLLYQTFSQQFLRNLAS